MKRFWHKGSGIGDRGSAILLGATAVVILGLYVATLAQTLVLGDPTEYTFIANILGIAHPPGYAFITVVGKLFQTLIPIGIIPWRMHLLAAVSATVASLFVFGTVSALTNYLRNGQPHGWLWRLPALFAALTVATAVNLWQHAIHANPHIITATFLAANLFFLTKWWADQQTSAAHKWLYIFCVSAGLGVTHHPLTVFGFPGYALFIVWVRPSILHDWRTLLKMVMLALLGLSLWLYYPLRSPSAPFGPTTMNTLSGFLDHVLARGLSDSLPYVPLAEQPNRAIVFWSILRLQYTLPIIFLALTAFLLPPSKRRIGQPLLLYAATFLPIYAFVISLRQQDIMAYLLGPLLLTGLLAGVGLLRLLHLLAGRFKDMQRPLLLLSAALFLFGPVLQIARNLPRISLRHYSEGSDYVNAVFDHFAGSGANVTLLNDWERMTPLWYEQYVNGRTPNPADVRLEFISAGDNPWLQGIFNFLGGGPVYLSNFRPDAIAGTDFRLRPEGVFYQVVVNDATVPDYLTPLTAVAGDIELVGYELPETAVTAGDFVPLTLAMRAPQGTADYTIPILTVGNLTFEFTTDSHLITPLWQPNEVIVERFDFALPHDLPAGNYPLTIQLKNLSTNTVLPMQQSLGSLAVTAQPHPVNTDHLLANFRQRVGLVKATVWGNGRRAIAPWQATDALIAHPGDALNIILTWEALAVPEQSYTVFVHLIDANNVPHIALDYTPLGGSVPTHLWIPKWLPGQRLLDPYRMALPPELPPGTYFIEVGLYEFIGQRRLHISDQNGNLNGDRYILGQVTIEP